MRFVQFKQGDGRQKLGVQLGINGNIIDLNAADRSIPHNLLDFLNDSDHLIEVTRRLIAETESVILLNEVTLLSPITGPGKVVCIGLNYRDHCAETNIPIPTEPNTFNKFPSNIIGPFDNIVHPPMTEALDWEVELAVIIGKTAKNVSKSRAFDYVFGYSVAQDISARDWHGPNKNNGQWLIAKCMDTFCPIGPAVVTKESLPDPHLLSISCTVNGVMKQNSNTSNLIFKVDDIITHVTQFFTLLPGDVILTGTPAGVGGFKTPRDVLKPGDIIESEIAGIGKIRNRVV